MSILAHLCVGDLGAPRPVEGVLPLRDPLKRPFKGSFRGFFRDPLRVPVRDPFKGSFRASIRVWLCSVFPEWERRG